MMFALMCHVDRSREADRQALRAEHLAFIAMNQDRIFAGGPTLSGDGSPELMLLFVEVSSREEAESFLDDEPYKRHGVFSRVDVRRWSMVLPETTPGSLAKALAEEQTRIRARASA